MSYLFEACVGSYKEGKRAEELGAHRIELCDNLMEGGTTPSYGTINLACKNIDIDINVIIRPRGGDFFYSDEEFEIMKMDINVCKEANINGVVIGILNENNELDFERTKELVELAKPLSVTFHMAFDEIPYNKKRETIDMLVSLGVNRILTAGRKTGALNNIDILKELVEYAAGRVIIMPGSGVTKDNYLKLAKEIDFKEYHGTKIVGNLL